MYTYLIKLNTVPTEVLRLHVCKYFMCEAGLGNAKVVADEPNQTIFIVEYNEIKEADKLITRLQQVKEKRGNKCESIHVYIVSNQLTI